VTYAIYTLSLVAHIRALESALGEINPVGREIKPGPAAAGKSETPARVDDGPPARSAQTRAPEESKTPVPSGSAGGVTGSEGEGQIEAAQDRPVAGAASRQRAMGTPRRSEDGG
jgi:hypothetical protein